MVDLVSPPDQVFCITLVKKNTMQTLILLLAVLAFAAFLYIHVQRDWQIIAGNHYPNKKLSTIKRGIVFAGIASWITRDPYYISALVLLQASVFWVVFDPWLNYKRRLAFTYLGKNSVLDRLAMNPRLQFLTKYSPLTWLANWSIRVFGIKSKTLYYKIVNNTPLQYLAKISLLALALLLVLYTAR